VTGLVVLTVVVIVLLVAVLAGFLYVVGSQLGRVADGLAECADLVWQIKHNAEPIIPGVDHINSTGGAVAGALPLLYGMAEGIVSGVTTSPEQPAERRSARPQPAQTGSGRRRSRLHDGVGYRPLTPPEAQESRPDLVGS
jgi:hypothetical protein